MQDASLEIPKYSSFWGVGYELTTCDENVTWSGIIIEEEDYVNQNYERLIFDNMELNSAKTGIKGYHNTSLSIKNSIFRNSQTGIYLHKNQDLRLFEGNLFEDLDIGVDILHGVNVMLNGSNLNPNNFTNCKKYGIRAYNANTMEVMYNNFYNCGSTSLSNLIVDHSAIFARYSEAVIALNDFNDSKRGIVLRNSDLTSIYNNTFTNHALAGRFITNNNSLFVSNNTVNGKNGFNTRNTFNAQLFKNVITHTTNDPNEENYGIKFDFGGYDIASRNTINSSNATAGLIFNNNSGGAAYQNIHTILNQDQTAGIRIDGAVGVHLSNNIIQATGSAGAQSFGIVSSAGATASLNCNDIFDLEEAIVLEDNSLAHDIFSNYLSDAAVGIKLEHSIIGQQEHRGNHFYGPFTSGDIDAQEMELYEIAGSKFIIDQADGPEFWPITVLLPPNSSSNLVDNLPGTTQTCTGPVTNTTPTTTRLLSLCDRIRAIQNNPNIDARRKALILARYMALIKKYYKNENQWTDCIRIFMQGLRATNTDKMTEAERMRDSLFTFASVPSTPSNFDAVAGDYIAAINTGIDIEGKRQAYRDAVAASESAYDGIEERNDLILSEIENIVTTFTPQSDYEDAWHVEMSAWVQDYKGESFTASEKQDIENVASLCPLYYGHSVHAARAIASTWNDHRFDKEESCEDSYTRSRKDYNKYDLAIYPNPSTGLIYINGYKEYADIRIQDVLGSEVAKFSLSNEQNQVDISHLKDGVYMITITDEGRSFTKQIIKVQ